LTTELTAALTTQLTADMSVAPEIARLAEAFLRVPAQPATRANRHGTDQETAATASPLTLGALSRELRTIAATPERWWGLVRFEHDRSVAITVEECASYRAWLVVMPPGDTGQACDCEVATLIAGDATETTGTTDGAGSAAALRPGPVRVHGGRHGLRGQGARYSISLHARARRPGPIS
jgi:hypothetical protein